MREILEKEIDIWYDGGVIRWKKTLGNCWYLVFS